MKKQILTVAEVSEETGLSAHRVRTLIKTGLLHKIRGCGRHWKIARTELDSFLSKVSHA